MTTEDAIKFLEKEFDKSCGNYRFQNANKLDFEDALWLAISALRAQKQAEKNEPLSLEELRKMDGEPVYLSDLCEKDGLWEGWIVFTSYNQYGFIPRGGGLFSVAGYGKTWLAYRRKPKEE